MGKTNNLVIVESPSKAKTIGQYLGPGYTVKASMGHLRDLPKSKMGVDIEHNFAPQYIPVRGKEALIKELKSEAAKADTVYLATDPDREGEAISWHLKELLALPDDKAQRVTFNERLLAPDGDILGSEIMLDVHAHFALGQVPQVAHAGLDGVAGAKILPDGLCLGGRLHDHKIVRLTHILIILRFIALSIFAFQADA